MSELNDFGFSTVSADEYAAQQTTKVDTAKEVAGAATASVKPELEKMTDRKEELNDKWGTKMNEVEGLILPLLLNLAKDGDKREWIRWPNRTDTLNKQIDEIKAVTRGEF